MKSVRQAIYRRRKTQPKLPESRQETHEAIQQYDMFSSQDEKMMHINNSDTNITFSTETNLKCLSAPDIDLFADGTFQYCQKFYYQFNTIHAFRNDQYIPCAFLLLPEKTKQTCINMFQHIVHNLK